MLQKRTSKALLCLILLLVLVIPTGIAMASRNAQSSFVKYGPSNGSSVQSTGTVTIVWGSSSGATSYEYCYDTINNSSCDNGWYYNSTNTIATLSSVSIGTTYYWAVRANGSSGTVYADGGSWWAFTPVTGPTPTFTPAPFAKSIPANGSTNQSLTVLTAWNSVPGATEYQYCYDASNNSNCDSGVWTSTGTTQWVYYSGLAYSTTYSWQVRALVSGNYVYANSNGWWTFTTMATPTKTFTPTPTRTPTPVPPSPAFVKYGPSNGSSTTSSTIVWGSSYGVTQYQYCYDTTNNNSCDTSWVSNGTSTVAPLSGLTTNIFYYWQVRAINGSGVTTYADGSSTSWWSFKLIPTPTPTPTPAAFGKSNPANGGTWHPGTSPLAWSTASGATQYEYCLDTINNGACDTAWVSTGTNPYVFTSGQTIGITYSWQVRALVSGVYVYANSGSWWTFLTN